MLFCIWSIMYDMEAYICSAIVIIAFYMWYHYSLRYGSIEMKDVHYYLYYLRAYNRFGDYDTKNVMEEWTEQMQKDQLAEEDGKFGEQGAQLLYGLFVPSLVAVGNAPTPPEYSGNGNGKNANAEADELVSQSTKRTTKTNKTIVVKDAKPTSIASFLFGGKDGNQSNSNSTPMTKSKVSYEGYAQFGTQALVHSKSGDVVRAEFKSWERLFFVLSGTSLWVYTNKEHYITNSKNPLKTRPIDMTKFSPVMNKFNDCTVQGIILNPIAEDSKQLCGIKVDTVEESNSWFEALLMSHKNNGYRYKEDVVVSSK